MSSEKFKGSWVRSTPCTCLDHLLFFARLSRMNVNHSSYILLAYD